MMKNRKLKTVGAFFAGAGVGAAAALLYAPQAGWRTRRNIRKYADATFDQWHDLQDDVSSCIGDRLGEMSDSIAAVVAGATRTVNECRMEVVETLKSTRQIIDDSIDRLAERIRPQPADNAGPRRIESGAAR